MGLKPLSVVVLDAGGHVVAFERADGASPGRFEIAHGKAYGCVMLGIARHGAAMAAGPRPAPAFIGGDERAFSAASSCRCRAAFWCATRAAR